MKVYRQLADFKPKGNAIVTVGTFDGVHLGHQKILTRVVEKAKELNGESVLLTFWPYPKLVLSQIRGSEPPKILSTIDEKIDLLESLNIDHLIILPFTREFSELSREEYIEEILIKSIGTKVLVIGYDHRFGRNREGSIDYLVQNAERFKIDIEEISRQEIENLTISSTQIRQSLISGEIKPATELLGRNYDFCGTVIKGRQLGRTLGYPTANVNIANEFKLIPKNGVYAVRILVRNQWLPGVMSIGTRPTVNGKSITQEVYIFDFSEDIYGEEVKVKVINYIREELKFDSVELMVDEIKNDVIKAKEILQNE